MTQGLQTAVAGLRAIQQKIEVLANNVANLNTNGYNK
ncbi:MAG: flagellar biosynthesis protein FlgC, partial [Clostridia bacterium]|nr:flagellar biosynthesis protein FlgC [Clostridia bacterium]